MARRPNYGQERAERQRRKNARRDERLAAKTERRDKDRPDDDPAGAPMSKAPEAPMSRSPEAPMSRSPEAPMSRSAEAPGATMPVDTAAIGRLAKALAFVCKPDHPATLAVQRAAASGDTADIERARTMFLQLGPKEQRAALSIADAASPSRA